MQDENEVEDLEREAAELRGEVEEIFDDLQRLVGELPGSRRGKEAGEDGGQIVRIATRRWRRR
jgi:hypothetical protein